MYFSNSQAFEQLRAQQEQRIAKCKNLRVREAALKALLEVARVDAKCELLRRIDAATSTASV